MSNRSVTAHLVAGLIALGIAVGASPAVASASPAGFATAEAIAPAAATPPTDPGAPATDPVTPVTEPVTPVTTPDGPVQPTDNGIDWLPILVVIGGLLIVVAVVAMLMGRKPRPASPAAPPTQKPPTAQTNLLSTAQWIHDQLSLELLAAGPGAAQQRWSTERARLDNVVIASQQQWADGHGTGWQQLGQVLSSLGSAIDTNIQLRAQATPDPSLVAESNDVVNRHRGSLQQVLTALWSVTPR